MKLTYDKSSINIWKSKLNMGKRFTVVKISNYGYDNYVRPEFKNDVNVLKECDGYKIVAISQTNYKIIRDNPSLFPL